MSLLRSFTAESLTVLAAGSVFVATAVNVVPPEGSILFVLGLVVCSAFHVIATQVATNPTSSASESGDSPVVEEMNVDESVSLSGLSASESTESSVGYDPANSNEGPPLDEARDRDDDSPSTKPVFGSKRGPRSNRRNNGPNMGRR